ncbi:permease-like cell division protein FtsX [Paraglaciecola polaris]|uniref:Cell division protein FtsX n=1 Tax=Paraglaciecola polaris LMG 21857 TaxID=1129793 RepID=K6ZQ68_9ALTE|nr:permease-like cell division protein FtsX [Paraglaciecola polaris]GAC32422.1 cell division transport system permease protein [Paraglaciecola polaris LMG 21857]
MSLLFKGRAQGAKLSQISIVQRIQMFFLSHLRQSLGSLGEMWRAGAASLMTIGVLGLSITLPSTLYILVKNVEQVSAGWDQASEISLFLKSETSKQHIDQLLTRINAWPEVGKVTYIPADDALDEFKALSGFGDAIAYLDKNPLPPVVLVSPTEQHSGPTAARMLLEKLQKEREVDIGKLDVEWLKRLDAMLTVAKELVTIIALLLFLAVVLIIGNTIRLNILSKKDEILVMKLVGATDAFIQRPFMYTGFWYGLLGGLLAWFTVICLLWWMSASVTAVSELYQKQFNLTGVDFSTLLIMLSTSVLLGLTGSIISVKRHVSAIEPK